MIAPRLRTSLSCAVPNQMDKEAIKREGWQAQSILVVSLDDRRLDGFQREFVKQIGEKLYGRKK